MSAAERPARRALLVSALLARPAALPWRDDPNRPLFAQLIAGRHLGEGCLPSDLGLGTGAFVALWSCHFPGPCLQLTGGQAESIPEWDDLLGLLLAFRAGRTQSELWVARILATACAGRDHLWQDLGLPGREELSRLMQDNFPALAALNVEDMKWKKFIYRQLCAREGIYVCPAPSCGQCADQAKCFGPES